MLKKLLKRVPENNEVFWINGGESFNYFSLPGESALSEIKNFAANINLKLIIN